jgi:hypothetical protein
MRVALVVSAAAVAAAFAALPQPSVLFEATPRAVTPGRDPVLSVRASGALSLLKVENKDLWLQTSFDGGDSFEERVRVNDVPGEVSSHHESSPQMVVRTRSEFYVLWQTRRADTDGSALRFAKSVNWGESFSKAIDVDKSVPASSQSFYSMNVSPEGVIYVAWLDGRDRERGRPGTSAVYIARSANKGVSFEPPVRVSMNVCPCCRPSIAFGADKTVHVAWRGVVDDNVRDIYVSTSADAGATWREGVRVAEDNWKLNGCPHSGATMATAGSRLFIAWSTVREGKAQVYLASSEDGGKTFRSRMQLAEGVIDPNHPSMLMAGDKVAVVFQGRQAEANQGWGPVGAWYREVDSDGRLSKLIRIGNAQKSASYPVLAFEEPGRIFVAWTEAGEEAPHVILARGRRTANVR